VSGRTAHKAIEAVFRIESAKIIAGVARMVRDVGLAEELAQDALVAALETWPASGVPDNPAAWLMTTAKNRALDRLRQRKLHAQKEGELTREIEELLTQAQPRVDAGLAGDIDDDLLRLVFVACHPVLSTEARVALTLRLLGGLTTDEIARAFLVPEATIAQRIVRAKRTLAEARVPFEVPGIAERGERLASVLEVIYLVFNEGYSASAGAALTRHDLSAEAIRIGRLLLELLPEPEAMGLLALMLLHESRREARTTTDGDLVLLEDQDRSRWNQDFIREGAALVQRSLGSGRFGPYTVQAAIAAVHAEAAAAAQTDWPQIVGLYDVLAGMEPSPVVELNRAAAVAMRDGPAAGLALVDAILARGELDRYHLAHAARADFCRRLGRNDEALVSYARALELARQEPERRFLQMRMDALRR
jgi:RNA polymerase sigma-70 factor (ECF subfamily)